MIEQEGTDYSCIDAVVSRFAERLLFLWIKVLITKDLRQLTHVNFR